MDQQLKLWQYDKSLFGKTITKMRPNSCSLEEEKNKFISIMCDFIDRLNFEIIQLNGRPRHNFKDIVKSLLMMSYHGFSYRRTISDLEKMHQEGLLSVVPSKSVLNLYANQEDTSNLINRLIQTSALFFRDEEDTVILDSTWLALRMYIGGHKRVYDKKLASMEKCRKLHIAILKNSKIIGCAYTSKGTTNDSLFFEELVKQLVENGFMLTTLLADAGYSSKNNYAICKELGILEAYIDFKSNASIKRAKSDLWKEKLELFKGQKAVWKEAYKYRALVEQVFSVIKRKHLNYLRSRNETAQDVELLLKCLVYNITVIGRYT